MFEQLKNRNLSYSIAWEETDLSASWLSPGRLLLFLEAAASKVPADGLPHDSGSALPPTATVTASVDGTTIPTLQSFNCRGLHRRACFSGFYFDLTIVTADTEHKLVVKIEDFTITEQMDINIFFDNVELELSSELAIT